MNTQTIETNAKPTLDEATKMLNARREATTAARSAVTDAESAAASTHSKWIESGKTADEKEDDGAQARLVKARKHHERAVLLEGDAQRTVDGITRELDEQALHDAEKRARVTTLLAGIAPQLAAILDAERTISKAIAEISWSVRNQQTAAALVQELRAKLGAAGLPIKSRSVAWIRDLVNVQIGILRAQENRERTGVLTPDGWTDGITRPAFGDPSFPRWREIADLIDPETKGE